MASNTGMFAWSCASTCTWFSEEASSTWKAMLWMHRAVFVSKNCPAGW